MVIRYFYRPWFTLPLVLQFNYAACPMQKLFLVTTRIVPVVLLLSSKIKILSAIFGSWYQREVHLIQTLCYFHAFCWFGKRRDKTNLVCVHSTIWNCIIFVGIPGNQFGNTIQYGKNPLILKTCARNCALNIHSWRKLDYFRSLIFWFCQSKYDLCSSISSYLIFCDELRSSGNDISI